MSQTLWKGHILLGLLSLPVKLKSAASEEKLRFNKINKTTGNRVKQCWKDSGTGKDTETSELTLGYEIAPDHFVLVDSEEMKAVAPISSKTIRLEKFIPSSQLGLEMINKTYYLVPEEAGVRAYTLLTDALELQGAVGIGSMTRLSREHLVAVTVGREGLLISTLYYSHEMRQHELTFDPGSKASPDEISMGRNLVEKFTQPFDHTEYRDSYQTNLKQLIDAKSKGKKIPKLPATTKPAEITDLMAQLKASLK
jgi:DNA end-binding protein Ku